MSEISETEIKSMSKEQNYMRGYRDEKFDVLDKIRAEIEQAGAYYQEVGKYERADAFLEVLSIFDKYKAENESDRR